jgi:hypothetical protein
MVNRQGRSMLAGQYGSMLLLNELDNVVIAPANFATGERVHFLTASDGVMHYLELTAPLQIGHKIARCPLESGETVLKYGAPIGHTVRAVEVGEHVHVHNLSSDYTRTHAIE